MERCLQGVACSTYVVLLQTHAVLTDMWALLAAHQACVAQVPIVCVAVSGSGYEFGSAKQQLEGLSDSLELAILAQMKTALSCWNPPTSVEALQSQLASTIPAIIAFEA